MIRQPLISIGIPVYRRPGYLLQSAGSVISQTYRNWELTIAACPDEPEFEKLKAIAFK